MSVLSYRGLSARIEFDADDLIFTGRIVGINDVVGFHSDTAEALVAAFHEAVDDYLAICAQLGKAPEKSYSGKLMLRVDPSLHARLVTAAKLAGKSLNQFGEEALHKGLASR